MKLFDTKPLEKHILKFLADRGIEPTPKILGGFHAEINRRLADLFDLTVNLEILVQIMNYLPERSSGDQAGQPQDGRASTSS